MRGKFYGIGTGPGDPELLTYKAVQLLSKVDVVAVPVTAPGKKSLALSIARPFIDPRTKIAEIVFPMTDNKDSLEKAWKTGRQEISTLLDQGQNVAFLTLGDPMLYSTYIYLYHHLQQKGYHVVTVPGISAFSAAAAAAGVPLAIAQEKMAIFPASAFLALNRQELTSLETIVIFKVARYFSRLVKLLEQDGRLKTSVLVTDCGLPTERIVSDLSAVSEEGLSYFSLIISRREPVF